MLGIYLGRVKVYEDTHADEPGFGGRITPLLNDLMFKRRIVEVALDLVVVVFAYYASYMLRFEQSPFDANLPTFTRSLAIVVACKMISLFVFGAYRGVWRYTSLTDVVTYAKASAAGSTLAILALLAIFRFQEFSRSLFVIDALVTFLLIFSSRLSFRLIDTVIRQPVTSGRSTLIYGAGDGGQFALRELLNNEQLDFSPIGFIDDDPTKHHRKILGYPVLGPVSNIEDILDRHEVAAIIISSEKIDQERWMSLIEHCAPREIALHRLRMRIEEIVIPDAPIGRDWQESSAEGPILDRHQA